VRRTVRPRWTCVFMTLSSCCMTMRSVSACLLSAAHSPLTGICSICTSLNSTTPSRCPVYLPHETLRHFFLFFFRPLPPILFIEHPLSTTNYSILLVFNLRARQSFKITSLRVLFWSGTPCFIDSSAAADRRIRRRIFVRRKSARKITARQISRRILLAVNPP